MGLGSGLGLGFGHRLGAKVRHAARLIPRVPQGESPADHAEREPHHIDPAVRLHVGRAPALALVEAGAPAQRAQHLGRVRVRVTVTVTVRVRVRVRVRARVRVRVDLLELLPASRGAVS